MGACDGAEVCELIGIFFGVAEESFEGRLYNHNLFFINEFYKNGTELSKEL